MSIKLFVCSAIQKLNESCTFSVVIGVGQRYEYRIGCIQTRGHTIL